MNNMEGIAPDTGHTAAAVRSGLATIAHIHTVRLRAYQGKPVAEEDQQHLSAHLLHHHAHGHHIHDQCDHVLLSEWVDEMLDLESAIRVYAEGPLARKPIPATVTAQPAKHRFTAAMKHLAYEAATTYEIAKDGILIKLANSAAAAADTVADD